MHGERIGFAQTPMVAVSYLIVAGFLFACAKLVTVPAAAPVAEPEEPEVEATPA